MSGSLSPISMRNIKGPRTDRWGTPDVTSLGEDLAELTRTCYLCCVRKQCIHSARRPVMPKALILFMVMLMSTLYIIYYLQ